jgi:aminopeptidase N
VRGSCASGLGTLRTPAARYRLIKRLKGEVHPRARRIIARALGDFVHDPAAGTALAAIVGKGDASYFVEAEACLALGRTRTPRAGELLRQASQRESFTDVVRQHAYRGLAEARDDSAVGLLADGMRWGRATQGRRAAAGSLAQLMRGRRDREARDVRERVELLLGDPDFRVQAAAIEALAVIGDPAAIAPLNRMIERELDGRLRRRGKEVARDLGEGAPLADDVRRLRDEVAEMRTIAATLRERIELIEAGEQPAAQPAPPVRAKPKTAVRKKPANARKRR